MGGHINLLGKEKRRDAVVSGGGKWVGMGVRMGRGGIGWGKIKGETAEMGEGVISGVS